MSGAATTTRGSSRNAAGPIRVRRILGLPVRRVTVADALDETGLPADLRTHLQRLLRRTRLQRSERIAIALELADHLQSMLDDGVPASEAWHRLVSDPQVATLLGRSARRLRPWPFSIVRMAALATTAILLLYAGAAAWMWTGSPRPTVNYLAKLNERAAAVPEGARAWPAYRDVMFQPQRAALFHDLSSGAPGRPGDEGWDRWVAWRDGFGDEGLERLRRAAAAPGFGYVARYGVAPEDARVFGDGNAVMSDAEIGEAWRDHTLFEVQLPYYSHLRNAARLLWVDALESADHGDFDRALADLDAILGTAKHATEIPVLIGELVRVAIAALAVDAARSIVDTHAPAMSDEQLARLQGLLDRVPANLDPRALEAEQWSFDDFVQRIYTDDGAGDGRLTVEGIERLGMFMGAGAPGDDHPLGVPATGIGAVAALPAVNAVAASRRELTELAGELYGLALEAWHRPWHQATDEAGLDERIAALADDPILKVRYAPLVILMPAVGNAPRNAIRGRLEADAIRLAVAVERHRRRTGAMPTSPADLVADGLPELPDDPFRPGPVEVRFEDGGVRVWSVGADRDDDGGTPPADRSLESVMRPRSDAPDGDWVLWPPVVHGVGADHQWWRRAR